MDDALLMGVLHGIADLHEQPQSLGNVQPRCFTVFGDRHALNVLHDEEGPARFRQPAVQHLSDVGVVHHGQRLPLGLEARQYRPRIHAGLDELQGHFAADWLHLLGDPHGAHAAFADRFQQFVAAGDDGAGLLVGHARHSLLRATSGRREVGGIVVSAQQQLDTAAQFDIFRAKPVQDGGPLALRHLHCIQKHRLQLFWVN